MSCAPWHRPDAQPEPRPEEERPPPAPHPARSPVFGDVQVIAAPTRARRGYLAVDKTDKGGRVYKGQDECVISDGMLTSRQMEKELLLAADETGTPHDRIRLEPFEGNEVVPMST